MISLIERLRALSPHSSGRTRKEWLKNGRVLVNDQVVRDPRTPVGERDTVRLTAQERAAFPQPLRLVHEDADILVIDKPPGLLTIATERERDKTAHRLLRHYLAGRRPPERPFIVHRLDRETSGLVVFAKTAPAKRHLQAQFEARNVERTYIALVEGRVREDEGTLESWLTEDQGLRVRAVRGRSSGTRAPHAAKQAITRYRVLERRAGTTLLELGLGTGRRRQIRVQLAELGHPIVGDLAHGSRLNPFRRLCLHAMRLGFLHPATSAFVRFESPAPAFSRA